MAVPLLDPNQPSQAEMEALVINKAKLNLACAIIQARSGTKTSPSFVNERDALDSAALESTYAIALADSIMDNYNPKQWIN